MHLGDDPVKFRTASALVPSYIWCGRVVQETDVPDRVGVRCPDDVSEQTGGFFFEVLGETLDLPFCFVVSCALLASSNTRSFVFFLSMDVVLSLSICRRHFTWNASVRFFAL